MSEIQPKSKSPKFFFEIIRKKERKICERFSLEATKTSEEHLMKELIRMSYKSENGNNHLKIERSLVKNKRKKYKMFGVELKKNFIEIVIFYY
jgi:hypothetical protein